MSIVSDSTDSGGTRGSLIEVLAAAVGSGGLLSILFGWLIRIWSRRKMRQVTASYRDLAELYRALMTVLADTRSERVLVGASSNCGGRPAPGTAAFVDTLYEARDKLPSVLDSWRRRPVDKSYAALLERLAIGGEAHLVTTEMPEGMLRTQYVADGVTQAFVVRVAMLPRSLVFLAVQWTEDDQVQPREMASIQAAAARITELLRRNQAVIG